MLIITLRSHNKTSNRRSKTVKRNAHKAGYSTGFRNDGVGKSQSRSLFFRDKFTMKQRERLRTNNEPGVSVTSEILKSTANGAGGTVATPVRASPTRTAWP